jgi:hypothetical protein
MYCPKEFAMTRDRGIRFRHLVLSLPDPFQAWMMLDPFMLLSAQLISNGELEPEDEKHKGVDPAEL